MPKKQTKQAAPEQGAVAISERDRHHAFGPSKWPALLECPCFQSKPPTEDTQRGTELHALFEAVLKGTYEGEPADAFERHVVNAALELQASANTGRFRVEELVELPPPSDSPGTKSELFGRLDLGWRNWDTGDLHVVDLKLSEHPDRDHRAQLLAYAAGLMHQIPCEPPLVYLHVVYADSGRITEEVLRVENAWSEYNADYRRIEAIRKGLVHPLKPRQCGWCELCDKFTSCPAMNEVVAKASPRLADAAKPERWADFTSKQKAQACALAETLAKWCSAVKENAAADAKNGERIEDAQHGIYYGLQPRAGKWTATPDEAWAVLRSTLPREHFTDCLSLSASKLKAKLRAVGKSPKEIEALLESAGTRAEPTQVFVRKGVPA